MARHWIVVTWIIPLTASVMQNKKEDEAYEAQIWSRMRNDFVMPGAERYTTWTITTNCGESRYVFLAYNSETRMRYPEYSHNILCARLKEKGAYNANNYSATEFDTLTLNYLRGLGPIDYLEDFAANATQQYYNNLGIKRLAIDMSINSRLGICQASILSLKNNSLSDISNTIFSTNLKTLILDENALINIDNITAPSLTSLSLNNNSLPFLPAMGHWKSLQRIEANNNKLTSISYFDWNKSTALTYLSFANNKISDWPPTLPPSLAYLNLNSNNLTTIQANFPKTLESLCMGNNPISEIHATTEQFSILSNMTQNSSCGPMFTSTWLTKCSSETRLLWNSYPICIIQEQITPMESSLSTSAVLAIISASIAIVGTCFWFLWRRKRSQKWYNEIDSQYYGMVDDSSISNDVRYDDKLQDLFIPPESIERHEIIAMGGFGMVHLATINPSIKTPCIKSPMTVAMKRMLPEKAADPSYVEDFMEEIRLCARLSHKNVVQFLGFSWTMVQNISTITEYMENGDLWTFIQDSNELQWNLDPFYTISMKKNELVSMRSAASTITTDISMDAMLEPVSAKNVSKLTILMDIVEALVYLHSMTPPIIHRDLKAKNILLDSQLVAKVTDFGISRESCDNTMTAEVGTVAWIAPEVLKGVYYSEKADIYSLGVVMSELDTGEYPYSNLDYLLCGKENDASVVRTRIAMLVVAGDIQPKFSLKCPRSIVEIAKQCLSYHPADRPRAMEVLEWLKELKSRSEIRVVN